MITFKKKKEITVFEEAQSTLLESIKETTETVNFDPSDDKQIEALTAMSRAYADIVKAEAEMTKVNNERKSERNKNIVAVATTAVTTGVSVGLTLVTFAYETSGCGNFFTTAGRQTIANVLRNIKSVKR